MKHLTKTEMRSILQAAKAESERDWLMILVAYLHALRASEVCGNSGVLRPLKGKTVQTFPLRGTDVRDGSIIIKRLKGSLKTEQPLMTSEDPLFDEKAALEKLAASNSGILFPITRGQYWRIWQKYGAKAGIKKSLAHPHIAKHSILTHAVEANVTLNNIRKHAGHKSLASTGAYLDADDHSASMAVAAGVGI